MRAKKSLGQNFLKSSAALGAIVDAGDLNKEDLVLEVGPGKGALTGKLLEKAGKVLAIEADEDMLPILQEKFEGENLEVKKGDILDFDEKNLGSYKLIANIPYYITGEIIQKFLSSTNQPEKMVILIQKEVAQRIVANDGKESILSISVKVYGKPKYIQKVPARAFTPAPKVDSAVLSISHISKDNFKEVSETQFFTVVKTGFAHKRKKLVNNLEKITPKEEVLGLFEKLGLKKDVRAENLSVEQWISLSKELS
jgi:16S rRNA (adenine1518-N6/adenine1519-N6)-dimethyltransferase